MARSLTLEGHIALLVVISDHRKRYCFYFVILRIPLLSDDSSINNVDIIVLPVTISAEEVEIANIWQMYK